MHTERNAVCNLTPLEYVCGVAFSLVRLSLCLCCLPVHEGSETEAIIYLLQLERELS